MARSYSETKSQTWVECTRCNTFINTYVPQSHQYNVHSDAHRIIGNFGAYGTGKTTTSLQEIIKHGMITPNANILVGANVASQYEQTIKRELETDIPAAFVGDYSIQKQYMDFVNGARVMYRPFDDPDKLRSYDLSMAVIIESSEVKPEAYHQLKTRLRNMAASSIDQETGELTGDWRKLIAESNPDPGWVRTELLLTADKISQYGTIHEEEHQEESRKDRNVGVHIASTDTNRYLPKDFIEMNSKNKPSWWVARFIYGSFSYADGLVYPSAINHIVQTFVVPKEWKRIIAHDYGLHDDAVFLFCAVDIREGIVYIYKEIVVNNNTIDQLAALYHLHTQDIPSGGLLTNPIIDPKSGAKRDYDKKSLSDLYLAKGISFKPGHVSVNARVMRTNAYFEAGKLKIMACCPYLIKEIREYKFRPRSLETDKGADKPVDKANHAINPLEWICMELPDNPKELLHGVYDMYGRNIMDIRPQDGILPYALVDTPEVETFECNFTQF